MFGVEHRQYLILGIGTDVGKTFLVQNLCKIFQNRIHVIKPVVSGHLDEDLNSDSAKILSSLGILISKKNLDSISPWRFKSAISPHLASKAEGKKISFSEVKKFCSKKISIAEKQNKILLIEAAGGVMTPITDKKTFLDLAEELKIPVLLVSADYLGSISHTLCAVEALKSRKVLVEKIIVNDSVTTHEILIKTISKLSDIPIVSMRMFRGHL